MNSLVFIGPEAPQESILYSLVAGRTELIMFGGLRKDISVGGNSRQEAPTLSRLNFDYELDNFLYGLAAVL